MNRFRSYLESQKLAKLLLIQAEEQAAHGKPDLAMKNLIRATREFMTCTNCLASMKFEGKRK